MSHQQLCVTLGLLKWVTERGRRRATETWRWSIINISPVLWRATGDRAKQNGNHLSCYTCSWCQLWIWINGTSGECIAYLTTSQRYQNSRYAFIVFTFMYRAQNICQMCNIIMLYCQWNGRYNTSKLKKHSEGANLSHVHQQTNGDCKLVAVATPKILSFVKSWIPESMQ